MIATLTLSEGVFPNSVCADAIENIPAPVVLMKSLRFILFLSF